MSSARICKQQHVFLLRPNGVLTSNVQELYYSDENGTIFILHIFEYSSMGVFIVFKRVIVKLINNNLVFWSKAQKKFNLYVYNLYPMVQYSIKV